MSGQHSDFLKCQYEWDPIAGEWHRPISCEPPGVCPAPSAVHEARTTPINIDFSDLGPVSVQLLPYGRITIVAGDQTLFEIFQRQPITPHAQTPSDQLVTAVEVNCSSTALAP